MKKTIKNKNIDNFDKEIQKVKYTPSGWQSWSSKLAAEFLGTIFLTWMIGLLGVTFKGVKFEAIISFGIEKANGTGKTVSHLIIGWWVALDVLICLAVFARWSCDLNPAVSTYRMISGRNSLKWGMTKIGVQLIAGLVAGLAIWSTQEISHSVNGEIDSPKSLHNTWSAFTNTDINISSGTVHSGTAGRHFLALGGEFIGGLILLWPIFTKSIKKGAVRDIILVCAIGFGAATMLEIGTVGWNPARTLGTNWIFDVVKGKTVGMELYWAYALGPILSAFALYYTQIGVHKYIAPAWEKWLSFGQIKDIK